LINSQTRTVSIDGKTVELTKTEIDILYFVAMQDGKVITYAEVIDAIWGEEKVNINRLRSSCLKSDPRSVITATRLVTSLQFPALVIVSAQMAFLLQESLKQTILMETNSLFNPVIQGRFSN